MLFTWPAEEVLSDDGKTIGGICQCLLPSERSRWFTTMKRMATRTKAYGILLVDPTPKEVKLIFETMHGTRAWTIPIKRFGDVDVLGAVRAQDNVENIGLLWNRAQASS
jgi:hypothetical protein